MRIASFITQDLSRDGLRCLLASACLLASCAELIRPVPNQYLAETKPPPIQEFRWSNGRRPTSLDPAYAGSAPETDIVRAVYEGLTVADPKTLEAVPGVAEEWFVADDGLKWTFKLRSDAKWSNGKSVVAEDFVSSWQRLNALGQKAGQFQLLDGFARISSVKVRTEASNKSGTPTAENRSFGPAENPNNALGNFRDGETVETNAAGSKLDLTAPDHHTLVVTLARPDADFPKLVSHPIFAPVYGPESYDLPEKAGQKIISNGAFKVIDFEDGTLTVARSEHYWKSASVKLDRIVFVSFSRPDEALEAYRTGNIDAVTNTDFAPLAQKVFSPYSDFRKSAFAALNFYEFNHRKPPFNDRRIREALAISIEREKLADGELEGTTQPAFSFIPFSSRSQTRLVQDKDRARELLEQAGFADGNGFPVIKLVVNRNDVQIRVARAVARMWRSNLNIETEILTAEPAEMNGIRSRFEFDLIRRGVVLPAASETVAMAAIFDQKVKSPDQAASADSNSAARRSEVSSTDPGGNGVTGDPTESKTLGANYSENKAIFDLYAIPLYFPVSFSLVKPYVLGFESNSLEAQLAASISIDSFWEPKPSPTVGNP